VNADSQLTEVTYIVPDLSGIGGEDALSERLLGLPGVDAVVVELDRHRITVHGERLDVTAMQASIERAGYQAA
jgi:copper chaperone CopZ